MSSAPVWAERIRAERTARGWSQAEAVRILRSHADGRCAGQESLLRQWKRWERGDVEPGTYYRPLISKTFGTVSAALFPPARSRDDATTGMAPSEIADRLRLSDVSPATFEALRATADRLACEYSTRPAEELVDEGGRWLRRLMGLTERRLTLAQHREVVDLAGHLALLVGCVEYDLGLVERAEATRRAALSLGEDCGDPEVVGWAYEMRAWYALTHYRSAIEAAEAGFAAIGSGRSVAVQLGAHKAKALAPAGRGR